MPTVDRLEASKHVQGRVMVFFRDAEMLRMTAGEVLRYDLYAGRELTQAEYEALTEAARYSAARTAGARLCARRLLSRGELVQKLSEKGIAPEYGEAAADWLEEMGALNDPYYATTIVRYYAGRGYGRKKLECELLRRKIPRELWEEALEEMPDPSDAIDRLIQKRLPDGETDQKALARVQSYLLRRGFSWQEVREGLERWNARTWDGEEA